MTGTAGGIHVVDSFVEPSAVTESSGTVASTGAPPSPAAAVAVTHAADGSGGRDDDIDEDDWLTVIRSHSHTSHIRTTGGLTVVTTGAVVGMAVFAWVAGRMGLPLARTLSPM